MTKPLLPCMLKMEIENQSERRMKNMHLMLKLDKLLKDLRIMIRQTTTRTERGAKKPYVPNQYQFWTDAAINYDSIFKKF